MGAWLTMEALRKSALAGSPDLHGKLGNVMLAAPDIDLTVFKNQMQRLDPSHFSVYVSKGDRALQVSASIQGDRRLGSIDPGNEQDREMIEKPRRESVRYFRSFDRADRPRQLCRRAAGGSPDRREIDERRARPKPGNRR